MYMIYVLLWSYLDYEVLSTIMYCNMIEEKNCLLFVRHKGDISKEYLLQGVFQYIVHILVS